MESVCKGNNSGFSVFLLESKGSSRMGQQINEDKTPGFVEWGDKNSIVDEKSVKSMGPIFDVSHRAPPYCFPADERCSEYREVTAIRAVAQTASSLEYCWLDLTFNVKMFFSFLQYEHASCTAILRKGISCSDLDSEPTGRRFHSIKSIVKGGRHDSWGRLFRGAQLSTVATRPARRWLAFSTNRVDWVFFGRAWFFPRYAQ